MGLIGLSATGLVASSANAFWGGGKDGGAERYQQMRSFYLEATSYEDFQAKMESHKAEKKASHTSFQESITKTVLNLSNGVEVTMTSDDSETVTRLQNRSTREPREGSEITTVKTNLSNGVKITTTTDNSELVEKIQSRAERKGQGRGFGRGHGKRRGEGQRGGKRGGRGGFRDAHSAE